MHTGLLQNAGGQQDSEYSGPASAQLAKPGAALQYEAHSQEREKADHDAHALEASQPRSQIETGDHAKPTCSRDEDGKEAEYLHHVKGPTLRSGRALHQEAAEQDHETGHANRTKVSIIAAPPGHGAVVKKLLPS